MRLIKRFRVVMDPDVRQRHKENVTLVHIHFSLVHTFMLLFEICPSAAVVQSVSFTEDYE
jgi:hypothetical protein